MEDVSQSKFCSTTHGHLCHLGQSMRKIRQEKKTSPKQNKTKTSQKKTSPNKYTQKQPQYFLSTIPKKTTSLIPTIFFDSLSLQKFQRTKAAEVRHLITNLYSAPWLSVTDLALLVGDGV